MLVRIALDSMFFVTQKVIYNFSKVFCGTYATEVRAQTSSAQTKRLCKKFKIFRLSLHKLHHRTKFDM